MFDPYYKWLGIASKDQPPNHYRLLGVNPFESDLEVIDAGANRQMAYLQQRATGEHSALSQKLLNEVAAARICLLSPARKAKYDTQLKHDLSVEQPTTAESDPPQAEVTADRLGRMATSFRRMLTSFVSRIGFRSRVSCLWATYQSVHAKHRLWQLLAGTGIILLIVLAAALLFAPEEEMLIAGKSLPVDAQISALENKIVEWQGNRDNLNALLEQLDQDKADVLMQFDELGLKSNSKNDPKTEILAQELKEILQNTATCKKKLQDFDLAILKCESRLRSIKRRLAAKNANATDADIDELNRSMFSLDESLANDNVAMLPIDFDNTVEKEMASFRQSRDSSSVGSTAQSENTTQKESGKKAPAVYLVTISPTWADLKSDSEGVAISGIGGSRKIVISGIGSKLVTASCSGFNPSSKWLWPAPGSSTQLSFKLESKQCAPEKPSAAVAQGNVALASQGVTVTGPYRDPHFLNDGEANPGYSDASRGYAKAQLGVPCAIVLKQIYGLQRVRIKFAGSYRYKLEVSEDNLSFRTIETRWSTNGVWQQHQFDRQSVRVIRLTGLEGESGMRVIELEAYCN